MFQGCFHPPTPKMRGQFYHKPYSNYEAPEKKIPPNAEFEMDDGLSFIFVDNNHTPQALVNLNQAKALINQMLGNMSSQYIIRTIFSKNHTSCMEFLNGKLVGVITFRNFKSYKTLIELVFCVVDSASQANGMGAKLISRFKTYCQSIGVKYILTYADITALRFFEKQGFTFNIPKALSSIFDKYIKSYNGAALMSTTIYPEIDYLHLKEFLFSVSLMLKEQLEIPELVQITKYPIDSFKGFNLKSVKPNNDQICMLRPILDRARFNRYAGFFIYPISTSENELYSDIISHPMDFQTIETNLQSKKYTSLASFLDDLFLIFKNCYAYNEEYSKYFASAQNLEKYIRKLLYDMDIIIEEK